MTVVKLMAIVIAILLICKAITMVIPMFSTKAKIKKKWKEYTRDLKVDFYKSVYKSIDDLKLKIHDKDVCVYVSEKHVTSANRKKFDFLVSELSRDLSSRIGLNFVKETKDGAMYFKAKLKNN